ncbi:MAG: cobalamin-dependent protein [Patescibacteria group bacterium]
MKSYKLRGYRIYSIFFMNSTRVALIAPGKNEEFAVQEPLNLGYIAAYLEKHNIQVNIIDQLAGQNVYRELKRISPQIVGITGTTPVITAAYKIADFCRQNNILTVIGGVHASTLPEEALKHADIVVKGGRTSNVRNRSK